MAIDRIGEIRDPKTALTAVRAANSGHLVLATMHSPVAVKAIRAMVTFGVGWLQREFDLLAVPFQQRGHEVQRRPHGQRCVA